LPESTDDKAVGLFDAATDKKLLDRQYVIVINAISGRGYDGKRTAYGVPTVFGVGLPYPSPFKGYYKNDKNTTS